MADLDAEFALFQAELASLETATEDVETKDDNKNNKREREEDDSVQEPPSKVKKSEPVVVVSEPVVIAAKPKIYTAPPRPVPVRNDSSIATTEPVGHTEYEAAPRSGALSGFPEGTSGEYAAYANGAASSFAKRSQLPINRQDMATGGLLSAEESSLMNMQQSAYEYDPSKAARAKLTATTTDGKGVSKPKKNLRMAGGDVWEDQTLADWPDNDFRLFIGDLGNEVSDEILCHAFSGYASFQRARVVRDKHTFKTKGFGFVSFSDPFDCAKALREMNGKYIGNRPVKISKSKWQDRNIDVARKKAKKKNKHHLFG